MLIVGQVLAWLFAGAVGLEAACGRHSLGSSLKICVGAGSGGGCSMLSPSFRSSLVGAVALASLSSPSIAGPASVDLRSALADPSGPNQPILVWGGEGRVGNFNPAYRFLPRGGRWGGGGWGGGHWGHGHGGWGHGGWGGWGSGFALGLGLGLPLGYYGGYGPRYDDYDPGYYDAPVYRPRVYRPHRHYYQNYNSYNGYYQCENYYLTGPVRDACR
jgi:hypothetical protein